MEFPSPPGGVSSTHACPRLHDISNTDDFQLLTFFKKCLSERKSWGRGREADTTCTLSTRGESVREAWLLPGGCKHINSPSSNETTKRACSRAKPPTFWKGLDSSPSLWAAPSGGIQQSAWVSHVPLGLGKHIRGRHLSFPPSAPEPSQPTPLATLETHHRHELPPSALCSLGLQK